MPVIFHASSPAADAEEGLVGVDAGVDMSPVLDGAGDPPLDVRGVGAGPRVLIGLFDAARQFWTRETAPPCSCISKPAWIFR